MPPILIEGSKIDAYRQDPSPVPDGRRRADLGPGDAGPPVPGRRGGDGRGGVARPRQLSPVTARLFDADRHDRRIDPADIAVSKLRERQLLWIDIDRAEDGEAVGEIVARLELPDAEQERLGKELGRANSWRSEDRLHLTLEALEAAEDDADQLIRREIDLVA